VINEKAINKMISQVSDPTLRNQLASIATGKIVKQIRCLSKTCQGKIIGYMYDDGRIEEVTTFNKKGELVSGLLGSRPRLDGQLGIQCACMNDSRLAESEDGIITDRAPTKDDLDKVASNLQKKPTHYLEKSGTIEVDNFIIEKVKI
jgi:hypothetical protein